MASTLQVPADQNWYFAGTIGATNIAYPKNQIANEAIKALAGIEATKVVHQHAIKYVQPGGVNVAAATVPLHTFRSSAEIVAAEVVPIVAPNGGDSAYTVDVQKGNQSTPFASVLGAPIGVGDAQADREVVTGSVTTTAAADGDTLQAVVAVSGTTGTQGQGFILTVWVRENP